MKGCGDVDDIANNGGMNASESDCVIPCSGDPIHICGGTYLRFDNPGIVSHSLDQVPNGSVYTNGKAGLVHGTHQRTLGDTR